MSVIFILVIVLQSHPGVVQFLDVFKTYEECMEALVLHSCLLILIICLSNLLYVNISFYN